MARRNKLSPWDPAENGLFETICRQFDFHWSEIAREFNTRTNKRYSGGQCLNRWNHINPDIKKGSWSSHEDQILTELVTNSGPNPKWPKIALSIEGRTAKQCRERWKTGLDPEINRTPFTEAEDRTMLEECRNGKKWAKMARLLERVDNSIKNRWNTIFAPIIKEMFPSGNYEISDIQKILDKVHQRKENRTPRRVLSQTLQDITPHPVDGALSNKKQKTSSRRKPKKGKSDPIDQENIPPSQSPMLYQSPPPSRRPPRQETPQQYNDDLISEDIIREGQLVDLFSSPPIGYRTGAGKGVPDVRSPVSVTGLSMFPTNPIDFGSFDFGQCFSPWSQSQSPGRVTSPQQKQKKYENLGSVWE